MAPVPAAPRYLVVYLPGFRLERCGWEAGDCVALVGEVDNAPRILHLGQRAARAGVRRGMTLAEARATCPHLCVEPLNAAEERADLEALSRQLHRFSPVVATLPPHALAAELPGGGIEEAEGQQGERLVLEQLVRRLAHLGHGCRAVVADDLLGARMLATWGREHRRVPAGGLRRALAPLPVQAMDPPPSVLEILERLGLETVGRFAALPPAGVAGRFGTWGVEMHRLVRGEAPRRVLDSTPSSRAPVRHLDLPGPTCTLESLFFVLHRLLAELGADLDREGRGVVRLLLELELESGGVRQVPLGTGRPMRSPLGIHRLLRRRLEGITLDEPVRGVRVELERTVCYDGVQEPLLGGGEAAEPLPVLVARLQDLLGADAVSIPRWCDSWRPEAAWHPVAPATGIGEPMERIPRRSSTGAPLARNSSPSGGSDPVWPHESWRRARSPVRPALLLPEPRAVEFQRGRGGVRVRIESRWHRVVRSWGPECLEGEWWERPFRRTYRVLALDDGRLAWVYWEMGRAFLHGWFDQGVAAPAVPLPEPAS